MSDHERLHRAGKSDPSLNNKGYSAPPTAFNLTASEGWEKEEKSVSSKAFQRLELAREAIDHTKDVLEFGAGNQASALQETNLNSGYRVWVMRNDKYWKMADSVKYIAKQYPEALVAAKADLAQGGNCEEHGALAFDYLRLKAKGETLNMTRVDGLDHRFVVLGDIRKEADNELTISDPWPVMPTATLWEDHIAYTEDRSKVKVKHSVVADGVNAKQVIAAGLALTEEGKEVMMQKDDDETTEEKINKNTEGSHALVWNSFDTAAVGKDYEYVEEKTK